MVDFSIVTTTRDRPEAIKLCKKYVERQTIQPKEWLIVDDGDSIIQHLVPNAHYIRREPQENDPAHTAKVNILKALEHIQTGIYVAFEDDDWYAPTYCETILSWLAQGFDLVGEGKAIYYHVKKPGHLFANNIRHASFNSTAFTSKTFDTMRKVCIEDKTIYGDINLWKWFLGKKKIFFNEQRLMISIKGMPGLSGQTKDHLETNQYIFDPNYLNLQSLIGLDYMEYVNYANK